MLPAGGFDFAVDAIGRIGIADLVLPFLKPGGRYCTYGIDDIGKIAINPKKVRGAFTVHPASYDESETHQTVSELVLQGRLDASLWYDMESPYPLDSIAAAFDDIIVRRKSPKALIRLSVPIFPAAAIFLLPRRADFDIFFPIRVLASAVVVARLPRAMRTFLKNTWLGLALIAACAAILLASDWSRMVKPASDLSVISVFQFSPRDLLNESVQGCLDRLAARGFREGRQIAVRRYDADADLATANSIAAAIADSDSRMVITFSTPALQVMAAANKNRQLPHLFGTVTDPFQSGVGFSREHPEQRPPYLAGIGTFQPVKEVWRLAKRINPGLKSVGVVWCTSETCSEACTVLAREVAAELGIRLVELPVSTSSEVTDAVRALIERKVEAIWIGGDNIVELAAPTVIELALQRGIPVFANAPVHAENGALLGLGADYYQVGERVGDLAADVLGGRELSSISVENVVPPLLYINTNILSRLRDRWIIPPDILASAAYVLGPPRPMAHDASPAAPGKTKHRVGVFYYGPDPMIDRGIEGLRAGLAAQGLIEGVNLELKIQHAQGDMSQIPQMVKNMDELGLDVLVPMTTPCLSAALGLAGKTPIVFTLVYDPIAAGAGADFTNHLPNVTGIGSFPPLADTMDFIRRLLPDARKAGTIYNPSELNSSRAVKIGRGLLRERGMVLEASTASSSSDLHMAALAVTQRGVDALWITGDNTVISGFASVAGVAREAGLPLVCNDLDMVKQGATAAVGFNPYHSGFAAAEPVARVLRGASPAEIPIENISISEVALNARQARERGARLDDSALAAADVLAGPPVKKWRIALLEQVDAPAIELTRRGMMDGLEAEGFAQGRDFELRIMNAQGEMSMLDSLVDAALAWRADMIATITTPALQTAMRKVRDIPVVFGLAIDPLMIGDSGTHREHRPNVAGIYDRSPFEEMMRIVRTCMPGVRKIGTVFAPAEINSTVFRDELEKAAADEGLELVAVPAQSLADVSAAALALTQRGIDLVCQINDNQSEACFPAIAGAARGARLPVFAFSSGLAEQGAALCLANDHYEGGIEAAGVMARIMRGQSPASLPYRPMSRTRLTLNLDAAKSVGLELPPEIIARADRVLGAQGGAAEREGAREKRGNEASSKGNPDRPRRIRMVNFSDGAYVDEIMTGIMRGLKSRGWQDAVHYTLHVGNAQCDMAVLSSLITAAADERPDVLLITSTPGLQAAIRRVPRDIPIIFGAVGAPVAAGAGASNSEHLPNITGISTESDFAGMAEVVRKCFPDAKAVGTLFVPAEVNSVFYKDRFEEELKKRGMSLLTRPVMTSSDVAESANALASTDIAAICQITDNLNDSAFPAIVQASRRAHKPLFGFVSRQAIDGGAALSVSRDFEQVGKDMVDLVERLFNGESLDHIPFRPVSKTLLVINPENADYYQLNVPDEILKSAAIAGEQAR